VLPGDPLGAGDSDSFLPLAPPGQRLRKCPIPAKSHTRMHAHARACTRAHTHTHANTH